MNASPFIFIALMLAVMWFLLIRPQRRRQADQARMLAELSIGDQIVTAGGLYGRVRRLDEERLTVEIAPGTTVHVARRAVAAVVPPEEELEAAADGETGAADEGAEPENRR